MKQPGRLRGFYRAVKRQEEWALKIWRMKDRNPLGYVLALCYRNVDFVNAMSLPSLYDLLPKEDHFTGKYRPVPHKLK